MKSLIVLWVLILLALILGFWWINRAIDQDIRKTQLNSSYVCCVGDFDVYVTSGPDLIPISEPFDIQPAMGYKVLFN